jgi:chorismate mutase/prephenate dehydratase
MALKVGFQGGHGTFSELAVRRFFQGREVELCGRKDFLTILDECDQGALAYGVLPVENTTTGIISRTYDLLKDHAVHAVGEIVVPIQEDCIGLKGARLEDVRQIYSHPEALAQCRGFLQAHPAIEAIAAQDTAAAAAYVLAQKDPAKAALASQAAAAYYGMETLAAGVQDSSTNMTRFFVVTAREEEVEDADKISILLVLPHEPGSLYHALGILAYNDINMLKLESRPIAGEPFRYCFYVDFQGNLKDPFVQAALAKLRQHSLAVKVLGCYKGATR